MDDNRSSADISQEIANKEKELGKLNTEQFTIEQEILLLQRAILERYGTKKDLEIANGKAKHLIRQKSIEIKLLEKQFWAAKNAGL